MTGICGNRRCCRYRLSLGCRLGRRLDGFRVHIYGTEMPDLGDVTGVPEPTYIVLDSEGVKPVDMLECDTEPTMHLDELMNLNPARR